MRTGNTYQELINFGNKLLTTSNLEEGLPLISNYLRDVTNASRCSIYIYNKESDSLWTVLSTGIEKIHIAADKGIVGHTFQTEKLIIENDIPKNPHFFKEIDEESGFKTLNMITCPIYNSRKELIGVLQLINKLDGFQEDNAQFLQLFVNFISSFIELTPYNSIKN